jgi:hypothetical protein
MALPVKAISETGTFEVGRYKSLLSKYDNNQSSVIWVGNLFEFALLEKGFS